MNCMKCGREIDEPQVFCPDCLAEMEKYPVKPGTVVQLPYRPTYQTVKKLSQRRKPALSLEDQVKYLRRWVWALVMALVLAISLLAGMVYMTWKQQTEKVERLPGQNYSSATSATNSTNQNTQR